VKERAERKAEIAPWRATEFLREMDRMFEDFKKGFEYMLAPIRTGWMRPWLPVLKLPESREACADIIDAGNEYRICAEVPGIPKEKLDITITPRSIEISGEARTDIREEKEGFVRQERGYSKIPGALRFRMRSYRTRPKRHSKMDCLRSESLRRRLLRSRSTEFRSSSSG